MRRHIKLGDCAHIRVPQKEYTNGQICDAWNALVNRNLRFDNKTGIIRDSSGELSRYSNPSDFKPYDCIENVFRWELRCYVYNSASRLSRGYPA